MLLDSSVDQLIVWSGCRHDVLASARATPVSPHLSCPPPFQAKHIWAPISPDEYDAAVRTSPALCPLAATGDRRSGWQLLADATADARHTVVGLAACRAGRAELEVIAAAAEDMALT